MTEQRLRARPSVHKDVSDITSAPHQEISIVDVQSLRRHCTKCFRTEASGRDDPGDRGMIGAKRAERKTGNNTFWFHLSL